MLTGKEKHSGGTPPGEMGVQIAGGKPVRMATYDELVARTAWQMLSTMLVAMSTLLEEMGWHTAMTVGLYYTGVEQQQDFRLLPEVLVRRRFGVSILFWKSKTGQNFTRVGKCFHVSR